MLPAQYCEIMAMTLVFGNAAVRQVTDIPRVGRLELEDAAVDAFKQLSLASRTLLSEPFTSVRVQD